MDHLLGVAPRDEWIERASFDCLEQNADLETAIKKTAWFEYTKKPNHRLLLGNHTS